MELGMIGLGRMGANMTERLLRGGHRVVSYDRNPAAVERVTEKGASGAGSVEALVRQLATPRAVWMMVPSGDPVDQTISEGALGAYGFVQVAGLLALAAGSLALAYCLRALRPPAALQPTIALITFSAACVVVVAVFPTDAQGGAETWTGRVHNAAATLAFISNVAAMLWSARAFRGDHRVAPLAGASLVIGATALLLLVLLRAGVEPRGLTQRAAVVCIQLWMILVALRLRSAERAFGVASARSPKTHNP